MWNLNDVYAANERIEDIRRAADKHNAIARMKAAGQGEQPGQQADTQTNSAQQKLWERVRKVLR
jgi:hypothetical protein